LLSVSAAKYITHRRICFGGAHIPLGIHLNEIIPQQHPFRFTTFCMQSFGEVHRNKVIYRLSTIGDTLKPTGVPTQVNILLQMNSMHDSIVEVVPSIGEVGDEKIQQLKEVMEENAIQVGVVTRDGPSQLLEECLERA
jgi:hypothetical protein